ncbi:HAD family hydrolase [Sporosalibacterium faouarense]|uniref:HAD family hydrolase n=1 Tax=Sporosalibacterium faouarense TaxID=516123 RepID=UPI00192B3FA1|nr:HAD family hydrolase [Sporosalibacterium faouarense]
MIQCIAIDMDGTLLNGKHEISTENIHAIKKAQSIGIEVVIATGRSYPESIYILEKAGIKCHCICVNGAEVRSPNGEIININFFSKKLATDVVDTLMEEKMYFEVFSDKGLFTTDIEKGIEMFADIAASANVNTSKGRLGKGISERAEFLKKVDSFDNILNDMNIKIYKILAFSLNKKALADMKILLEKINGIAISSSAIHNIEINTLEAQKGEALEAFVKERGISLDNTMAIGDNYNDLSMFQKVGRSVAMGNASEKIKEQCDFVTTTNEENGVSKAILDVLKIKENSF